MGMNMNESSCNNLDPNETDQYQINMNRLSTGTYFDQNFGG